MIRRSGFSESNPVDSEGLENCGAPQIDEAESICIERLQKLGIMADAEHSGATGVLGEMSVVVKKLFNMHQNAGTSVTEELVEQLSSSHGNGASEKTDKIAVEKDVMFICFWSYLVCLKSRVQTAIYRQEPNR